MKTCPKCNLSHSQKGTFCSRSCANSRGPRSDEFKKTVSDKLTGGVRLSTRGDNHPMRKGRNLAPIVDKNCVYCDSSFRPYKRTQTFCSRECITLHRNEIKSDWELYYVQCKFNFDVYDYPEWFDLSRLTELGWYTASNRGGNLGGISRDHMISVKYGFLNSISPEVISHPANCNLVSQNENSKKKTACSLTIDELMLRINAFNAHVAERPNAPDCKSENT